MYSKISHGSEGEKLYSVGKIPVDVQQNFTW